MVLSTRVAASGMVVAERYRLLEPLGAGGMGAVWRAEHVSLCSPVAVKLLNPAIADDPEMLDRFLREAQSAAALRGTYVVQVFDYGVHEGMPFIAMELLSGLSLGMRLAASRRLRYNDLAWVFAHVSRAVSKAHELGIVHRDLKPDNIFIVRDGDEEIAKVLDFGIAKVLPSSTPLEEDASKTTRTGTVLGTPFYMSPEQARGNRTVDFRADLWSMGVIAFECLTGRLPFVSSALGDLVVKICTAPTPRPSDFAEVPLGFDEWFARACEKTPDERFQSMREQNEALQAVLGIYAAPVSPHRSTPRAHLVTPEHSPLSADLSIDFGEFQTLESVAPPDIGEGLRPPNRGAGSDADAAAIGGVRRASSAAPVEVAAVRKQRPRWLPVLALAAIGLGFVLLVNRTTTQRTARAPLASPTTALQNAALGVALASEASTLPTAFETDTRPPHVASHAPDTGASGLGTSNPQAPNTAPMDRSAVPVKLAKKALGAKPATVTSDTAPTRFAPSSPTTINTIDTGATTGAWAPQIPSVSPTAGTGKSEISRGRELFDDRE